LRGRKNYSAEELLPEELLPERFLHFLFRERIFHGINFLLEIVKSTFSSVVLALRIGPFCKIMALIGKDRGRDVWTSGPETQRLELRIMTQGALEWGLP